MISLIWRSLWCWLSGRHALEEQAEWVRQLSAPVYAPLQPCPCCKRAFDQW